MFESDDVLDYMLDTHGAAAARVYPSRAAAGSTGLRLSPGPDVHLSLPA